MDYLTQVEIVRFAKLLCVCAYAAGVGIGLWGGELEVRKRAIHQVASPALLATWFVGYVLTLYRGTHLDEIWILGGFTTSLLAHGLLARTVRHTTITPAARARVLGALSLTLFFMVFRPTWWSVFA